MRRSVVLLCLASTVGLVAPLQAQVQVCITFEFAADTYEGVATSVGSSRYSLDLLELVSTVPDATYGSMTLGPTSVYLSMTKNTNAAIVGFNCELDRGTRSGPCEISVLFPEFPESNGVVDDTATLALATCPESLADTRGAIPIGE